MRLPAWRSRTRPTCNCSTRRCAKPERRAPLQTAPACEVSCLATRQGARRGGLGVRGLRFVALMMAPAMVAVLASGCTLTTSAVRYAAAPGDVSEPFWCAPDDGVALSTSDCTALSLQLDQAAVFAHQRLHA